MVCLYVDVRRLKSKKFRVSKVTNQRMVSRKRIFDLNRLSINQFLRANITTHYKRTNVLSESK